jgi:DNA-binding response OmpR family regulator
MKRIYSPTKRKRILIVDDDQVVASVYQKKLQRELFDVEVSCDSRHVLRMLEMEPFDLMILDLSASEMSGVEVLNGICSRSGVQALPVIVFSNPYLSGHVQAARDAGATRHITKSDCMPGQMLAIVREVLAISPSNTAGADDTDGARSVQSETEFQAQVAAIFFDNAPQRIKRLRAGYHAFVNSQQENLRLDELFEMHRQARLLAGTAGIGGFRKIARLACALEALLLQLHGKPTNITPSVTRTIAHAVDSLAALLDHATNPESEASASPAILVVDDEIISREAICSAIEKANFRPVSVDDPMVAGPLLEQTHFDLIFLDVEMPGQSGLDLCASIRKMATNRATPVVFVTAHSDFATWAQSSLSGGNDFIAKPFLSVELAVKALTWLFKEKLEPVPTADPAGGEDRLIGVPNEPDRSKSALATS